MATNELLFVCFLFHCKFFVSTIPYKTFQTCHLVQTYYGRNEYDMISATMKISTISSHFYEEHINFVVTEQCDCPKDESWNSCEFLQYSIWSWLLVTNFYSQRMYIKDWLTDAYVNTNQTLSPLIQQSNIHELWDWTMGKTPSRVHSTLAHSIGKFVMCNSVTYIRR